MPDPFQTLGVERRFDLDEAELHRRYVAAAAEAHPDRYADPIEQAEAADRAARINEAYRTLSDPERRANALLIALGGASKEQDDSLPPDLLMDMMQVRERLEAAVARDDSGEQTALEAWAVDQRQAHLDNAARLFTAEEPDLQQVRVELNALRYVERMIEQMQG